VSALLAYIGGAMLTAAILPQVVKLWRTRDASSFAWGFVALNAIGIALLAWRSYEIGERAFLILNVTTALFWAFVAVVKLASTPPRVRATARDAA
jgi:MtN3 and saliva related transmembrane protein